MVTLFSTKKVSEIKSFTNQTKLNNLKKDNHYFNILLPYFNFIFTFIKYIINSVFVSFHGITVDS